MNRALRRSAARAKKGSKKDKVIPIPKFIDKFQQFDEIDRLFQKISHGEIEYQYCEDTDSERPVLLSKNGNYFDVCSALTGWMELWREVAAIKKFTAYSDMAMALVNVKLKRGVEITFKELSDCLVVVGKQKKMFSEIDRGELKQISVMVTNRLNTEDGV